MSLTPYRYMWLLVLFDLPVSTKKQRKLASTFRKFLLKDGYFMLQFSVYARVCNGEAALEKHSKRLLAELPPEGQVRSIQITDKQYERIKILVGKKCANENKKAADQLLLF